MADRGAQSAIQNALAYDVEAFEHIQEPAAAFPEVFDQEVTDPPFLTDVWDHQFEELVDWGDQHTKHVGDGWYMTEPVTGEVKLQSAPNGRATVAGELSIEMSLGTATVAGKSTLAAPVLAKSFDFSTPVSIAARSTITATMRNTKALAGDIASPTTSVVGNLKVPGLYQPTVLADSPSIYVTFAADATGILYNHPSLGGQKFGTIGTSPTPFLGPSLVESEVSPSARPNTTPQRSSDSPLLPTIPTSNSVEFWYQQTTQITYDETVFEAWAHTPSSGDYVWLRVVLQNDGTLSAAHGYEPTSPGRAVVTSTFSLRDNLPHHIVVTWDSSVNTGKLSLYVDGQLQGEQFGTTGTPPAMTNYLMYFGQASGQVDELAVYPTVLSGGRVFEHYLAAWIVGPPIVMRGRSAVAAPLLGIGIMLAAASLKPFTYVPPTQLRVQRLNQLGSATADGTSQVTGSLSNVTGGPHTPLSGQIDGVAVVTSPILDVYLLSLISLVGASSGGTVAVNADLEVTSMFDIVTAGAPMAARREFT